MAATLNPADDGTRKKRRIYESDDDEADLECTDDSALKGFHVTKVLREDVRHKSMNVLGKFEGRDDNAVLLLERKPFVKESLGSLLSKNTSTIATLENDIYSTHTAFPPPALSGFKITMIHPATSKHIAKYSEQDVFVVRETKELYETVTLPSIKKSSFNIQWVYNILEKKSEADRIVFEDPDPSTGFILLPDMKWDGTDLDSLYLVAIVHQHGLGSLRDLTSSHLPLLQNIRDAGLAAVKDKYGIPAHKLRVYLHYQPSYYHLHVHFTHIKFEAPGIEATRAHLLDDVIENIASNQHYYQEKTLTYAVRASDQLYKDFSEAGYLEKKEGS